jgi:V/A-type H+-transporting ATPase subunit F
VKYFVIGERELVLAFGLAGVKGAAAVTRDEALSAFRHVTGFGGNSAALSVSVERPKVLIVTETVAMLLEEEILAWQMNGGYPLIVEVPGIMGHIEGKQTLTESIREAIGIHV